MKINKFQNEKKFIQDSLGLIEKVCQTSAAKSTTIKIALSGGSTPQKLYKVLSKSKTFPFERVEFYIVDERYIPKTNPDSNYKMISEKLINPIKARIKAFYGFDTSLTIQKSLTQYEQILKKNVPNSFDLIILGIGPDGHIASLFPHSTAIKTKKLVAHTQTEQFAVKDRLTITLPLILKSKNILVLLIGPDKKAIITELKRGKKTINEFPAKVLNKHKKIQINFLD